MTDTLNKSLLPNIEFTEFAPRTIEGVLLKLIDQTKEAYSNMIGMQAPREQIEDCISHLAPIMFYLRKIEDSLMDAKFRSDEFCRCKR